MPKLRNFVFYAGPSMIDGAPIVAIAKVTKSRNSKTGSMVQTYIVRSDMAPGMASKRGADVSICGDCGHRGKHNAKGELLAGTRSCYVVLCHGPNGVYKAFKRGTYEDLSADLGAAAERIAGRIVRVGTYGDPAAVPFWVWQTLLANIAACTGYTHQWRSYPELSAYCMASCDSEADRTIARALGFRTFRVAAAAGWRKESGEVLCPASAEAGKRTNCLACKACGGHSAKAKADIMIPAHGTGRKLVPAAA